jgi:hypothetical protein
MRRTAWVMAGVGALLVIGAVRMEAAGAAGIAGGAGTKWTVVELSMKPRADDTAPAWTVRLKADGAGTYIETGTATGATMPLAIGQETMLAKNVAKTGEKTILYEESGKVAQCTFNYSDDAGLMDAIATFQAIAETMQRGERLQHDLRYDRLGLDAEMEALVAAKQSGSAIEIGNIAPILQALVEDDHVIDRVRRRAARLLQDVGAPVPAGYDPSER